MVWSFFVAIEPSASGQKLVVGAIEHFNNNPKLNVGDEAIAVFYALHGVFVQVKTLDLEQIRKLLLGGFFGQGAAELLDFCSAKIVFSIRRFVFVHINLQ